MSELAIETRDLCKAFDGELVVDGLDWTLARGHACALLGPNGAGKTTTLRMLMGFVAPSRGAARVLGANAWDPPAELRARVGYVADPPVLPGWMRVRELVDFHSSFYARWDARLERELLELFALAPNARVAVLSSGQNRKLALLLALCTRPDLLLLDEPASGLDVDSRRSFLALLGDHLAQEERSLVFSTHLLTDVERIATDVLVLHRGRAIEQGPLDELQEGMRVVTLSTSLYERTRATWEAAEVLEQRDGGGSTTLVVRRFGAEAERLVATLPPSSVELGALPFEDWYLALTRAERERVGGRSA